MAFILDDREIAKDFQIEGAWFRIAYLPFEEYLEVQEKHRIDEQYVNAHEIQNEIVRRKLKGWEDLYLTKKEFEAGTVSLFGKKNLEIFIKNAGDLVQAISEIALNRSNFKPDTGEILKNSQRSPSTKANGKSHRETLPVVTSA